MTREVGRNLRVQVTKGERGLYFCKASKGKASAGFVG